MASWKRVEPKPGNGKRMAKCRRNAVNSELKVEKESKRVWNRLNEE